MPRSIPVDRLDEPVDELPADVDVVASCRGPACPSARNSVHHLVADGRRAAWLENGCPGRQTQARAVERHPVCSRSGPKPYSDPMAKKDDIHLKRGAKVYAAQDLPGVPEGTPGKVLVSVGLTWIRYRVRFGNGVELGSLDRAVLASKSEWGGRAVTA